MASTMSWHKIEGLWLRFLVNIEYHDMKSICTAEERT